MWNAWNQVSNLQTINEASPQTCAGFEDERHPCAKGRAHRADQFQLSNGLCAHSGSGVVLNHQGSCHELVNVHEDSRAQSSLGVDAGCGRLVVKAPGKANNMVATNTPGSRHAFSGDMGGLTRHARCHMLACMVSHASGAFIFHHPTLPNHGVKHKKGSPHQVWLPQTFWHS